MQKSLRRRAVTGAALTLSALATVALVQAPAMATTRAAVSSGVQLGVAPYLPGGCSDITVKRSTFRGAQTPVNWRENLAFDGRGRMWVSNYVGNRIEAYDPTGRQVASIAAKGPGGLALGPDGRMQVNTDIVLGGNGTISSFDPADPAPSLRIDVPKVSGHNGLAVDDQGRRYVTGEGSPTVRRYAADGTLDTAWTTAAAAAGSNGIRVDGNTVYATRLGDPKSSVVAFGVDNPAPRTVAELSPWVVNWKGLDDLAVVGDNLYVAGFISGEVIRVNKRTGANCLVANGIITPTSVRAPVGFGDTDPTRDLFITAADGAIHRLTLTPR